MLTLRNWEFFLRETFINIRRNGLMSLAAISTVIMSLCILGGFLLAVVNLDALAQEMAHKVDIQMYFLKPTSEKAAEAKRQDILRIRGVRRVRYVSREEGLKNLAERLEGQIDFSDIEKSNPLPDALEIQVADPDLVEQIVAELKRLPGFDAPQYLRETARRIIEFSRAVKTIGLLATLLLSFSILLIINNTIRLTIFARRREIRIMQLVGATNWFIKVPFLLEGVFHGVVGSVLASAILMSFYSYAVHHIATSLPFVPLVPADALAVHFLTVINLLGLLFGYCGSLISVRRFLTSF